MVHALLRHRLFPPLFLAGCCAILVVLWLPGIRYPVVSDTVVYAELGRSLWRHATYVLERVPYAKHLPLHPFFSYPFTQVFGVQLGMQISSLVAGWGVLIVTFMLTRRVMTAGIAVLTTIAVLVHPGFILMSMLGSADLLFCALFLASLLEYVRSQDDPRWYLLCGLFTGLACLTRYNGLPLFPLIIFFTAWRRRTHLHSAFLWCGMCIGVLILLPWFIRNALVFGNPLFTEYTGELAKEAPNIAAQALSNIIYYLNPVHNIFPFFFVFALPGLLLHGRRHVFLVLAMTAGGAFAIVWWVQAIRFVFPALVILLMFSALGMRTLLATRRWPLATALTVFLSFIALQGLSMCLYTYGACNAWFDRTIGLFPRDMHLTSEGFHTWDLARQYVNAQAGSGAVLVPGIGGVWRKSLFRSDLLLRSTDDPDCPRYRITQKPRGAILFQTADEPVTYVTYEACSGEH